MFEIETACMEYKVRMARRNLQIAIARVKEIQKELDSLISELKTLQKKTLDELMGIKVNQN